MKRQDLWKRIDDLESQLNHEKSIHLDTKNELTRIQDKYTRLHGEVVFGQNDNTKQSKEIKRLETANKKFMHAIDALKKAAANQEIMQDRYARETALKLAYAVAKADDHIMKHAKANYEFITDTEPEEKIEALPFNPDDLKFTHIDEV